MADDPNPTGNEIFKVKFATTKGDDSVSIYRQGGWTDFCRGPHVPSTGRLAAFKLLSVAGAYWLGSEKNKMLQRIYGTAFWTQAELDQHLHLLEEARKRDHRKLGKELDLFMFHPFAPGAVFWSERGTTIYNVLTGAFPYPFTKDRDPIDVILNEDVVPLRKRDKTISSALADVVDKALAKKTKERFQNASELSTAMTRALR